MLPNKSNTFKKGVTYRPATIESKLIFSKLSDFTNYAALKLETAESM